MQNQDFHKKSEIDTTIKRKTIPKKRIQTIKREEDQNNTTCCHGT